MNRISVLRSPALVFILALLTGCGSSSGSNPNSTAPLSSGNINNNIPGYYVFSAPWATISALLTKINNLYGYDLKLPTTYISPMSTRFQSRRPETPVWLPTTAT